jgi:hypothetical protein
MLTALESAVVHHYEAAFWLWIHCDDAPHALRFRLALDLEHAKGDLVSLVLESGPIDSGHGIYRVRGHELVRTQS